MLAIDSQLPSFSTVNQHGVAVLSANLVGKRIVIYFYPEDDTGLCTIEACNFRDNYSRYQALGYTVLGVSPDGIDAHAQFAAKFALPFDLLVDTDLRMANAFGVWIEKNMYGVKKMGIKRSAFVFDETGKLTRVVKQVISKKATEQILKE